MPRKKPEFKPESYQSLLVHYIDLYYKRRSEEPGIKHDPDRHIALAKEVIEEYEKKLEKYPEWNTEERKGALYKHIDLLTKVFSSHKEQSERKSRLEAFKESAQRKPRIIIY